MAAIVLKPDSTLGPQGALDFRQDKCRTSRFPDTCGSSIRCPSPTLSGSSSRSSRPKGSRRRACGIVNRSVTRRGGRAMTGRARQVHLVEYPVGEVTRTTSSPSTSRSPIPALARCRADPVHARRSRHATAPPGERSRRAFHSFALNAAMDGIWAVGEVIETRSGLPARGYRVARERVARLRDRHRRRAGARRDRDAGPARHVRRAGGEVPRAAGRDGRDRGVRGPRSTPRSYGTGTSFGSRRPPGRSAASPPR